MPPEITVQARFVTEALGNTDPDKVDIDEFVITIRSNGRVRADYCDFSGVTVERNHTDVINFYMEEERRANVKMDLHYKGIEDTVTDRCRKLITYILESKDASGEWITRFDASEYTQDTMWAYVGDGTNITAPTAAQSAMLSHGLEADSIRSQPWIGEDPVYVVGGHGSWFSMDYTDDDFEGL
jgi:hypothetical protein